MTIIKYLNKDTGDYELADSGAINDGNSRITPADVNIIEEARAGLIREQAHSGILRGGELSFGMEPNQVSLKDDLVALVNGYKITIPSGTKIELDPPPTFGKRNDLVYIKAIKSDNDYIIDGKFEIENDATTLLDLGYVVDSTDRGLHEKGNTFAIEFAKVERRNSGGYRVDNIDGSREHFKLFYDSKIKPLFAGEVSEAEVTEGGLYFDKIKVGDKFVSDSKLHELEIIEKGSFPIVTIRCIKTAGGIGESSLGYDLVSPHPNNLYSNIIDEKDILPLWHKVSLTGYNLEQLLEESFDKLLRGELHTKEKPKMHKEQFNLLPAPKDTPVQLMPVKVKGNDGVERELVNLFGSIGNFNSRGSVGYTSISTPASMRAGKYYLIIARDLENITNIQVTSKNGLNTYYSHFSHGGYRKWKSEEDSDLTFRHYSGNTSDAKFKVAIYEIDQETFDKIDLDPEFSGENLLYKFPYISSFPNVEANIVPPFTNSKWDLMEGKVKDDYVIEGVGSHSAHTPWITLDVEPGETYTVQYERLSGSIYAVGYEGHIRSHDGAITLFGNASEIFTVPQGIKQMSVRIYDAGVLRNLSITKSKTKFIPYGKWFLPHDVADQNTPIRYDLSQRRRTLGDPQTSEVINEIISPVDNSHLPHIEVTQATAGQWSIGDTIKVKSDEGIISGVIDGDTAISKVVSRDGDIVTLDSINGISDGDYVHLTRDNLADVRTTRYVKVIDSSKNQVSLYKDSALTSVERAYDDWVGNYLVEVSASTSSPSVKGTDGTWVNLGTKESTFTISSVSDNKTEILLTYSLNYPAGKGIDYVPREVLSGKVNGLELEKSNGIVKSIANFRGKEVGNTDLVPHIAKEVHNSTVLLEPSEFNEEHTSAEYSNLFHLDGKVDSALSSVVGQENIAQQLFSFNIIRHLEDTYGEGFFADCLTLADKVEKARNKVSRLTANWWGYGSSPSGNKASIVNWRADVNTWSTPVGSNIITSSTTDKATLSLSDTIVPYRIDSDGFVHFLVYAEPSDGVTSSTIYTDYVELEVEINVAEDGYDILAPVNKMPVLTDDPSMFEEGENMIPPFTSGLWNLHSNTIVKGNYEISYEAVETQNNLANNIVLDVEPGQNYHLTYDYFSELATAKLRVLNGKGEDIGEATSTFGEVEILIPNNGSKMIVSLYVSWGNRGLVEFKNPMLTKGSKPKPFVPYAKNIKRKKKLDFFGKVAGSTVENGNFATQNRGSETFTPSQFKGFTEYNNNAYKSISKPDGDIVAYSTSEVGKFVQQLFEFDLSHLNLSFENTRDLFRKVSISYTGYGKGQSGNGLTLKIWDASTSAWEDIGSNPSSSPSTVNVSKTDSKYITKDQKIYILAHSSSNSNGTIASQVFTDYISLTVEMSEQIDYVPQNVIKIQKNTKLIKSEFPINSYRTGMTDALELWYEYLPKQSLFLGNVNELTKSNVVYTTTVGSGKYSTERNRLIYEILTDSSNYLGESLHDYVQHGIKKLPIETNSLITRKLDTHHNYVAIANVLVEKDGQIYLRVFYQESKNINSHISPTSYVDFYIENKPLIK